jgi:hypothetical protein
VAFEVKIGDICMRQYFLFVLVNFFIFSSEFAKAENPDQENLEKVAQIQRQIQLEFADAEEPTDFELFLSEKSLSDYNHIDPKNWVPQNLLTKALLFFDKNKVHFQNQKYITIVDLAPRSNRHRLFIINVKTGAVERYRTTHGEGSDSNNDGYAESFSNISGSKQSSLGFVRTAEVYYGTFDRSLRLDGLSSTNTRIRERAIVFHGWKPVKEANIVQPRSWGCITSDLKLRDGIIDKIKNGSLMLVDLSN